MSKSAKNAIYIVSVILMTAGVQTLFLLSVAFFRANWQGAIYPLIVSLGTAANLALCVLAIVFYLLQKELIYKSFLTAFILLLFSLTVFYILLKTGFLEIIRDKDSLEAYLERAGTWMGVLFITLQFLQVVILPIPSFVTVAAGTALFGPLKCALYSLLGIVVGSLTAFVVGRYVGYRAVAWLIGKETLDKWLKKVKGKDKLLLSAMFLLPVFPDDILCFVAGLSSMSLVFFLVVILISRVIAIFTTCYSVTLIPFNTWWGITLWIVFFALVCVLFVVLYKKADAIQNWIYRKIHRETRISEKKQEGQFTVQIVDPDGAIVDKNVSKEGTETKRKKEENSDSR
ncbi:MAG: TVP38/TMEM64 family protein [Clostridia bacterium]|jgi:uncharacterized membrane protein YdjX (TVP38/TMEM64 family)|nr:TVP38/TMEM64 family protein [Clostridia bacterium]